MNSFLKFPKEFIWGSAVSGHQVEGNNKHSDWWKWELAMPSQPVSGKANDYWNRYEEDHALLASMGHQAFRLGIEWARIEPEQGKFDLDAVKHYHDIFKSLQKHGIKICLTLHHWVLPQWVAEKEDWRNPEMVEWFLHYTEFIIHEFGEYPFQWITLNEPMVAALAGYLSADFPPQHRNFFQFRKVVCNMLKAHAGAAQQIHERHPKAWVSIAMSYPLLETWGTRGFGGWHERTTVKLMKILIYQAWDESLKTGLIHPLFGRGRIHHLKGSIDFCGVNYYFRMNLRFSLRHWRTGFIDQQAIPKGIETSDLGWQIWPKGLFKIINETWEHFNKPIVITENGIADKMDTKRASYISEHLKEIHRAITSGIPISAYYHWSFIDNFEWAEGFDKKFGLVEVDYEKTELPRTPRPSAEYYHQIICENGLASTPGKIK